MRDSWSGKISNKLMQRPIIIGAIIAASCLLVASCASHNGMAELQQNSGPTRLALGTGDVVEIKFRFWPELDDQQTVRPDGNISLQLIDEVHVAGMTPAELDQHLTKLYENKLKKPEITVIVRTLASNNVYVGGEVATPGLMPLEGGLTALQAVIKSGGFLDTAKPDAAIVIRKDKNNNPVPYRVNLKDVLYDGGQEADITLQANDIVYVPKSGIAQANKFVHQYIERLLLFRGVGLSLGYELHDDSASD